MKLDTHRVVRAAVGLLVAIAVAACGGSTMRTADPAPPVETDRSGAALARVVVTNETRHALTIAFRPATPPGGEVVVGRVGAGEQRELAPVPAGEPIILVARTAEHDALELEPRTFAVDARWVWHIPANATFNEALR